MEATLTCAVCLSLFEEPVTLPACSHNFCRACVVACLGQARRGGERPPSPSSARQSPQERRPRLAEAELGPAPSAGDRGSSVTCPLCRKVCALPGPHGVAALPLNTTLAEVVKLFKAGGEAARKQARTPGRPSGPRGGVQDVPCEKHPGKPLRLFCRMCCRPACGQCVSEEHQGVFHSVGFIGTVYQEQKLNFFSYLKEIRQIHEQLVKEVASFRNDIETQKQKEEEMIKRQFEYISKTLEMKKQQLLDSLESQKEKREKEYEIWKKVKDSYRGTIETFLNECEKNVNECDPQRFLEDACSLNLRMKNQIDMIQITSSYENLPEYKQMHMDTTSVVHSIFALHLTPVNLSVFKDIPSRDRECAVFGNSAKKSEVQKNIQNAFKPMAGVDVLPDGRMIHTQIMSISEAPVFGEMSHEEARYNYYVAHQVISDDIEDQTYISHLNRRHIFPETPCSSNQPPEATFFPLSAKTNNLKPKPQVLQRQDVNKTMESHGFLFKPPAVNLNFSGSNNSFNLFNMKGSQKDSPKTFPSENTDSLLAAAEIPKANAAAFSFGMHTSLTVPSDLLQAAAPPVAVLNQHSSGAVTEHAAPAVFSSLSGKTSTPSLNKNSVFSSLLLEKPESQDSNINNLNGYKYPASTVVSFSTTTSPMSPPVPNKNEENQICCQYKENNLGDSGKKLTGNCNLTDSLLEKASCCVPEKAGASENQSVPCKISANYFWETNTTPVFCFSGSTKKNQDAQSSMTSADNSPREKSKMELNDPKHSALKNTSPSGSSKDLRNLMHSSSFFFMEKLNSETENVVPQENMAHDCGANKISVSGNLTQLKNPLENSPRNEKTMEDHAGSHSLRNETSMKNAEPDDEYLCQASNSNGSQTPSEYFSLAKENILPR